METKTMAQPLEKTVGEKGAKVQIYTPTHICTGYVSCPGQRRLLDVLNGILKSYRISPRGDRRFKREDIDGFLTEGESASAKD